MRKSWSTLTHTRNVNTRGKIKISYSMLKHMLTRIIKILL